MKTKLLTIIFTLFTVYSSAVFADIKYRIDGENLILNYKNNKYETSISGNGVTNQFHKGNRAFFEVHINPSHSELIVFNLKTKKFEAYIYTQYFINESLDILTVLDPPHFSSDESDTQKEISVNGNSVFKSDKSVEIDVKVADGKFEIYSDGEKTGYVSRIKNNWMFRSVTE